MKDHIFYFEISKQSTKKSIVVENLSCLPQVRETFIADLIIDYAITSEFRNFVTKFIDYLIIEQVVNLIMHRENRLMLRSL